MVTGKINGNSVVLSNNRTTIIESCPGDRENCDGDRIRHEGSRFISKTRFEMEEGPGNSRNPFFKTFLQNRKFRHKVLHTLCVGLSMISMGWRQAMIGPTFPDLMLIIDTELSAASWIFTTWSLGNLLGSMCGGGMYDRMNRLTVFIFLLTGLAVTTAMTPWCTGYAPMLIIHILGGLFSGAIDAVCTTDVLHVWQQDSGPYMQAVHFGFSFGAIISPLVSSPFLAKRIQYDDTISMLNTSSFVNSTTETVNTSLATISYINATLDDSGVTPMHLDSSSYSSTFNNTTTHISMPEYGPTQVHNTYLMASILSFSTACLFGILFFCLGSVYVQTEKNKVPDQQSKVRTYPLSRSLKIVFSILIATLLMLYVITERHFYSFLMTYVIATLKWSKTKGSNATAVFWISFASGRLTAVFVVKRYTQSCILVTYLILVIIGAVGFSISVISQIEELIWISIVIFGIGMSPIFASIFSWYSEKVVRTTGKMTGALYFCSAVGTMLFPLLAGYLMSTVSYDWFLHLLIMLAILLLILFVAVDTVYKFLIKKK